MHIIYLFSPMFDAKYLLKFLSVESMLYIIRIVSLRAIRRGGCIHDICTLSSLMYTIVPNLLSQNVLKITRANHGLEKTILMWS